MRIVKKINQFFQLKDWCAIGKIFLSMVLPFLLPQEVAAADTLRVAAIFSISGIAAPHNTPLLQMTEFAVADINKNGGVIGKQIELIVIDNNSTPIGSALAAQKAVDEDVIAVIGAHWSSHSLAMAPILQQAGIPMISPGSTNPEVTRNKSFIFRACFVDSFQGLAMARFATGDLGLFRAAVVGNIDENYSVTLAQFFKEEFEKAGGKIIADVSYRGSATDFSAIIKKIEKVKPEAIYIPGYTRDSGLFIKQARKMGITAVFLGGDAWDEITSIAGDAVTGSYQTAAWHPDVPFGESRVLQDRYFQYFGHSIENNSCPLAYDAVMLLKKAIESCQCSDRLRMRDSLAAISNFEGVTGNITFNDSGDPDKKEVIIVQFRNKKPYFVKAIRP